MKSMSIRWLPLAATLLVSASVAACSGNELARQVEESNSRLPQDIGYGMTLERLGYADSIVSAYINVGGSEVSLNTVRVHSEALKDDFAAYMREQPDSTEMGATVSLMKKHGASLQMFFCTDADTVAIEVPASEI